MSCLQWKVLYLQISNYNCYYVIDIIFTNRLITVIRSSVKRITVIKQFVIKKLRFTIPAYSARGAP